MAEFGVGFRFFAKTDELAALRAAQAASQAALSKRSACGPREGGNAFQAAAKGSPAAFAQLKPGEELVAVDGDGLLGLPDVKPGSFARLYALQTRIEQALAAPPVCSPLHLLDCCIISDGGGALAPFTGMG